MAINWKGTFVRSPKCQNLSPIKVLRIHDFPIFFQNDKVTVFKIYICRQTKGHPGHFFLLLAVNINSTNIIQCCLYYTSMYCEVYLGLNHGKDTILIVLNHATFCILVPLLTSRQYTVLLSREAVVNKSGRGGEEISVQNLGKIKIPLMVMDYPWA